MENSTRSHVCTPTRGDISLDPIENNYLAVRDEISVLSPDDYFDSGSFMPRVRLLLHGLSDRNVLKHCWCYFSKMQMDDALFFKQFDLYTELPGHVRLHPASARMLQRPPAFPPDAMENEPASHVERCTWDLLVVRVMSEWMPDDAHSEVLVGRVVLILYVKFAETGMQRPSNHSSSCWLDCPAHAEEGVEKSRRFCSLWPLWVLGLNSLKIPWFMDMSWFMGVQKAIGWPNGIEIVNIINLFVQVLDFGSPGSRTGRW